MIKGQRYAEILADSKWQKVEFMSIKENDIFRLFESTGKLVEANFTYKALSNAYLGSTGMGTIDCEIRSLLL